MQKEYRFRFPLPNGLHARPASMLAEALAPFKAEVTIAKAASGAKIDARSVLSVVGLDIKHNDECLVIARGPDSEAAIAAVRELVERRLATSDEPAAPGAAKQPDLKQAAAKLPIGLRRFNPPHTPGRAVCAGVAIGAAVILEGLALPEAARLAKPASADVELRAAKTAIAAVRKDLHARAAAAKSKVEGELLFAHAQIADDPALWIEIEKAIGTGKTAPQAVAAAAEIFTAHLRAAESDYIRERVVDVQDVAMQLLDCLILGGLKSLHVHLERDSILFSETLTPNQLLRMDRRHLKGLVLGRVGATSHTIILARSFRIPTLIDVKHAATLAKPGTPVILDAHDGTAGFVFAALTPEVTRYYEREQRAHQRWLARIRPIAQRRALTADGRPLEIGANVSNAEEVALAIEHGADGVGLFRTEFLFLDRPAAPDEEEQHEVYSAAIAAAGGRAIIFRTFDIGGDKPASYLDMPREENPFLGRRGLRLYEEYPDLLRTQLRAIFRASSRGPVKIMAPMVSTPAEAAWFRTRVQEVQAELKAAALAFDASVPVGIMIEVPSTALAMDHLADHADFFSIGTNDLCQYWMAVDRGNAGVANLCNPRQPSFLRLLRTIVDGAKARKKWIGLCGEMGGDRLNLPLMIALGLDEISVAPGEILALKAAVQTADAGKCRDLFTGAAACNDANEVEALLRTHSWRRADARAAIALEMIEVESDAATKEEAIKAAVDLLHLSGRTERPREVEEAVWAREETYSTGLGFGFAIPHCRSDSIAAPSLAAVKLRAPVEWNSTDGQPVHTVLLLAVPTSDAAGTSTGAQSHMKIFAKLARRLMHEEFRAALAGARDTEALFASLKLELGEP